MMQYTSTIQHESRTIPGVTFTLWRLSFGKRLELLRRIHSLAGKHEFLTASPAIESHYEAAILEKEIQHVYLECCLVQVEGLWIDGESACAHLLIERGPEALVDEITAAIQGQIGLSAEEQKN
jgi:hypothetical protein